MENKSINGFLLDSYLKQVGDGRNAEHLKGEWKL